MTQPPDGYELWSPKKGEVYPQDYMFYEGDRGWITGLYPGRFVNDDQPGYFCRPKLKPEIKADPNPPQLTMDKAFITQRPQWSALLDLSLLSYEIGNIVRELADSDEKSTPAMVVELDEIIDLLRKTADDILFTDHKETSDVK